MSSDHWRIEHHRLREIHVRNRAKPLGTIIAMGGLQSPLPIRGSYHRAATRLATP